MASDAELGATIAAAARELDVIAVRIGREAAPVVDLDQHAMEIVGTAKSEHMDQLLSSVALRLQPIMQEVEAHVVRAVCHTRSEWQSASAHRMGDPRDLVLSHSAVQQLADATAACRRVIAALDDVLRRKAHLDAALAHQAAVALHLAHLPDDETEFDERHLQMAMRRGATGELEDAMHRGMDKVRKERGVLPDVHLGEPVVHRIVSGRYMQRWDALAQARRRLDAWCAHVEASAHVPMPSKQQRAPAASEPHQSSSTQPLRQPRQPQRTTDHQPQAHESRAPTSSSQDHTRRHSRTMERDTVVHTPHEEWTPTRRARGCCSSSDGRLPLGMKLCLAALVVALIVAVLYAVSALV